MQLRNVYNQLARSPTHIKIIVAALVLIWTVVCGLLAFSIFFFTLERPGQALEATPGAASPVIVVEPDTAPLNTPITVQGNGWPAGSQVLIYVVPFGETNLPNFALADAVADESGRFIASFTFPAGPEWQNQELATIIARTNDGQMTARALFSIERAQTEPEETPASPTPAATGPVVSAGYPDGPATAVVALRVTDDRGATHTTATQVTVRNVAPVVEAGGPYAGQVGSPITLSGTAADPSQVDQASLTYHWDFGDGAIGGGSIVSYTYPQAGSYTVTLTVTDKDGAVGVDTVTVEVSQINQPPTALISGPESGRVGEALNFSGSGSSDSDGNIIGFTWDFGDGNTASGVNVTHNYSVVGNYQVTLTITDDDGLTASAVLVVQIDEDEEVEPNLVTQS